MFTRSFIVKVRQKAIRQRVWYLALDHVERGILSLAARVVHRVESIVLGVVLVKILSKVKEALKSGFVRRVNDYGLRRIKELSARAVAWGNMAARKWVYDLGFARYLTLLNVYAPSGWGV